MDDVSIDDTLRDTWASISSRGQEGDFGADSSTEQPEVQATAEDVERVPEVQESQPEVAESTEGAEDQQEASEEQQAAFRPPWKKAALAEWDKLPELTRKEIERRENDFHKGIEQYKAGAQASQEWDRTIQPYMATIQSFGVSPQVAVNELLKADHMLRYSQPQQKVGMLLKIAGDYGVDLNTLANGIQQVAGDQAWQQQNPVDPRVQQLQEQVGQLTQHITNTQRQAQVAEYSAIDAQIAEFAANPDHEHFGILQNDMTALLQSGLAKDLDDAYEKAMRSNPQTYQIWLAQQQQGWDAQRKAQVRQAKQAGANVVRPNGRASVPTAQPARTMDEDIEATARALGLLN